MGQWHKIFFFPGWHTHTYILVEFEYTLAKPFRILTGNWILGWGQHRENILFSTRMLDDEDGLEWTLPFFYCTPLKNYEKLT